jgi:hypothetical protein
MGVDPKVCVWLQAATSCRWRTVSPSTFKEIFSGVFSTIGDETNNIPQLCYTSAALHPGEEEAKRRRGNSIPMKQTASPSSPTLIPQQQQQQQQQQKQMRRSWINCSFRCKMPFTSTSKDSSKAHHHHPHEL